MRMSRKAVVLLVNAAVLLSISSCFDDWHGRTRPSDSPAEGSSAATSFPVEDDRARTVTLLIDKDTPTSRIEKKIQAIEDSLNIHTEILIRPNGSLGESDIKARLATGDMADLFFYNTGALLHALNPAENLLDLTGEPYCEDMPEDFMRTATVDGKVYAVPESSAQRMAVVWAYNRRVYRDLELDIPLTWDALMDNCEKIKHARLIPVLGSFKDEWTCQFILLGDEYNVKTVTPDFPEKLTANRAKYATTPQALRSFEKMRDAGRYLNSNAMSTTVEEAMALLAQGKAVHYPIMTVLLNQVFSAYPEQADDIGIFAQPGDDPNNLGVTVWLPNGIFIYSGSKKVDLAKRWLESFVSQNTRSASAGRTNVPFALTQLQEYFDAGKTYLALEYESPLKGQNCIPICLETLNGVMAPAAAAAAYDRDLEKQAIQLNLPGW